MMVVIPDDTTVVTERLTLTALTFEDADEMVRVLGDGRLDEFIDGRPDTLDELRDRYCKWVAGSMNTSVAWLNWTVRQRTDMVAVGTMQATVSTTPDGCSTAEMAWVIGTAWQGNGFASEAARLADRLAICPRSRRLHCPYPSRESRFRIVASRGGLHPSLNETTARPSGDLRQRR